MKSRAIVASLALTAVMLGPMVIAQVLPAPAPPARAPASFYDAGQASRGKAVFERSCRRCHTVSASTASDISQLRGARITGQSAGSMQWVGQVQSA